MDAQRSECLRCSLAESNIADLRLAREVQNIINRCRDVITRKIVNTEILRTLSGEQMVARIAITHPKVRRVHVLMQVVSRVFISSLNLC